MAFMA